MKVVWLCHFSSPTLKGHFNKHISNEFAPWIFKSLELFEKVKEIEIHVVAPNIYTNRNHTIILGGIHYHLYNFSLPRIPKKIRTLFNMLFRHNFLISKRRVTALVKSIGPDIVHLHGAENPYYSAGILPLVTQYPVLTSIQGFIRLSRDKDAITRNRIRIEEKIIKSCKHFGTRTDDMDNVIRGLNQHAIIHKHDYPLEIPLLTKDNHGGEEPIDCIFFARVTRDKGIEDLLSAISLVKKKYACIFVKVIGAVSPIYLSYLKKMCNDLRISDNIEFSGFLSSQQEIFEYAYRAKMYVLPTYFDIIPGTIIESMFLRLPVISYSVGGIPELNIECEAVKLVEKGNVEKLADSIEHLLNDVPERKALAERGFSVATKRFLNQPIVEQLTNIYKVIIQDFSAHLK